MASFVFELFPVGRQLKERGLRGPRLGPAVVSGHQSERQGVCPSPKPRLISWGNNAGLGGPSLDAEYELGRFVLLDWELHGSMGSHALSVWALLCLPCSSLLFEPKSVSPLPFTPFPGFPLVVTKQFLLHRATQLESKPAIATERLGRSVQGFFLLLWGLLQDPSLLTDRHTVEAAMSVWTLCSSCSHGPTERWAVPLLGDGASERAGDMLGQRPGNHCTEFSYYSNYCSNHGNATEDWSGLHCHRHRHGCRRGRRRSQRWVCSITRWEEAFFFYYVCVFPV